MSELKGGILRRQIGPQPPDPEDVLYSEKTLEGYLVVTKNTKKEETKIELELLFDTVIENREKVSIVFDQEATHA